MLGDISMGNASNEVRKFIIDSYVRGAKIGNAEAANFEGNTAVFGGTQHTSTSLPPYGRSVGGKLSLQVFTKRRYRRGRKIVSELERRSGAGTQARGGTLRLRAPL